MEFSSTIPLLLFGKQIKIVVVMRSGDDNGLLFNVF